MLRRPPMPRSLRVPAVLAGAAVLVLVLPAATRATPAATPPCALPSTTPLWIDYGDALSNDVRDVLARPGVIVTSGGKAVSSYFRDHGAATTYFELHLPNYVGQPSAPADPSTIPAAAVKLLAQAVATTGCSTPEIALNELFGSNTQAPWTPTNTVYRADVLELMQQLASRGGYPVLLVHGDYTVAGAATAAWWQQVARAGEIVYEAYYDAPHISALGPLIGNRRMRMGIRTLVSDFGGIGIPPARLGVMLGFHTLVQPGIGGREGLQPPEAWLRVVKWEALTARQVASETGLASVWSWGWGDYSTPDPDKPAAACVYLWTRDSTLCDGPAAAGPAFNASLTEGQIVLASGIQCTLPSRRVRTAAVRELTALTRNAHDALTGLFARASLETAAFVAEPKVLAVEQQAIRRAFHGSRVAYLAALRRNHATLAVARGIITDELRRRAIAANLRQTDPATTTLQWTDDREAKAVDNATCLHDDLPGVGSFPVSDRREIGVVPLPALLPFLFADRTAPTTPAAPAETTQPAGAVALAWPYGTASDLAGYQIFRAPAAAGPYARLGSGLLPRPAYVDATAPAGVPSYYEVRAVDTSGNTSAPSPPGAAVPGP